jgi:ketosteroid isomerase-like protein
MASSATALDLEQITERYFAAWAARDPDQIIEQHSADTQFQIHAGLEAARGRDAVREAFAQLFEQWPGFAFESHRVLLGADHWVLDWTLLAKLPGEEGSGRDVRLDCLDVVTVDAEGLITRKDTYVDAGQLNAIYNPA